MLTILVTGKDSQLAQCIKSLVPKYPTLKFIFTSSSELDITNYTNINSFFATSQSIDYCINCAAYTAVDKAEIEPEIAYNVNVLGPKNLAMICHDYNVTLFHISTDFVFGGDAVEPYSEERITNPLGVYGKTKLQGELAIVEELEEYFILRTSWLYSEFGNNFLKTMLNLAVSERKISVVTDQIGSPTYAKDLAEVILGIVLMENRSYGLYNYSNIGVVSWYNFAAEIFKQSSKTVELKKIKTKDYKTLAKRPKFSVLDCSKIESEMGISILNWKESLKRAILSLS